MEVFILSATPPKTSFCSLLSAFVFVRLFALLATTQHHCPPLCPIKAFRQSAKLQLGRSVKRLKQNEGEGLLALFALGHSHSHSHSRHCRLSLRSVSAMLGLCDLLLHPHSFHIQCNQLNILVWTSKRRNPDNDSIVNCQIIGDTAATPVETIGSSTSVRFFSEEDSSQLHSTEWVELSFYYFNI